MIDIDSPLRKAMDSIDIPSASSKLGYDTELKKSCSAPYREDRNPSLSIYGDGKLFKDHGTGKSGDVLEFVSVAGNVSKSEAAKMLISWHQDSWGHDVGPVSILGPKREKRSKKLNLPRFDKGSVNEMTSLRRSRSLPTYVVLELLYKRGLFGFCYYSHTRCWGLKDPAARNVQIRPLDPSRSGWSFKAKSVPGSDAKWPIGAALIGNVSTILLTEGTPDLLAAATAAWIEADKASFDQIAFCCMTGANVSISSDALPAFADKRVRLFVHMDEAGVRARDKWAKQLSSVTSHIDIWYSDRDGEDFNDWASRNWIDASDGISLPEKIVPVVPALNRALEIEHLN